MEAFKEENKKKQFQLLTSIANFCYRTGCLTEFQSLILKSKPTLETRKIALHELMEETDNEKNALKLFYALRCFNQSNASDVSWGKDSCTLWMIVSKWFETCLITAEEKLEYGQPLEVDKKAMELTSTIESRDSRTVSCGISSQVNENGSFQTKNPLLLPTVIKTVLKYLSFQEIEDARFISKEWERTGLDILAGRSNITFVKDELPDQRPLNYLELFSKTHDEIIPFSSFEIVGEWSVDELNYFFNCQHKYIKELSLVFIHLKNDNWETHKNFNMKSWLVESPLTRRNTSYPTKLTICHPAACGNFSVDIGALASIKILDLSGCQVNIEDGIKMSPCKLELKNVEFFKEGSKMTRLIINDIVNFSKATDVSLTASKNATKLTLEFDNNDKINFDNLILCDITLKKWSIGRWTINKLHVTNVIVIEQTGLEIRELGIRFSDGDINSEPFAIPQSVEKLVIKEKIESLLPVTLNNLKDLVFDSESRYLKTFSESILCPNLVCLDLKGDNEFRDVVDLADVPNTVKILKVRSSPKILNRESKMLHLEKLIVQSDSSSKAEIFLESCYDILAKDIFLFVRNQGSILDFVERYLNGRKDCVSRICVGTEVCNYERESVNWSTTPSETVETGHRRTRRYKPAYYVFENATRKAMDPEGFYNLLLE